MFGGRPSYLLVSLNKYKQFPDMKMEALSFSETLFTDATNSCPNSGGHNMSTDTV
jgi:hypothetical protein